MSFFEDHEKFRRAIEKFLESPTSITTEERDLISDHLAVCDPCSHWVGKKLGTEVENKNHPLSGASFSCDDCMTDLMGFLIGGVIGPDISSVLKQKIERHLATCGKCKSICDQLQSSLKKQMALDHNL